MTLLNRLHVSFNRMRATPQSGTLFAVTALALIAVPAVALRAFAQLQASPKAVIDQAWQIVDREFVDPKFNQVDWQQERQTLLSRSYASPEEAYTALRTALEKLDDPYTRFMNPEEFQALNRGMAGELTGVGMQLKQDETTKALTVVKPIENSPALTAGVLPGDLILQIDGRSTQDMTVETAAGLIRGEPDTQVRLQFQRQGGEPFELTLTRARISIPAVRSSLQLEGQRRIGYIRLNEFSAHAAEQMKQAITDLQSQNVDQFVLDLRGNPGGRLDQGVAIARMWINSGDIVRTVDRDGSAEQIRANNSALTDLPLAVLVDGSSASASEIVAGALKDDHRAVVIGSQTFGKALVQQVNQLADGSGLNVTIARYFTPSGLDINHTGITPDIVVDLTAQQKQDLAANPDQIGTAQDPQYQRAIQYLGETAASPRP
ncbi:MAG TPA: S41 family peptidase [Coleofasciculaceae cyanobacterium]|jgi:carboxyl-terminal processing protease